MFELVSTNTFGDVVETLFPNETKGFWIYGDSMVEMPERSRFDPTPPPNEVSSEWMTIPKIERQMADKVISISIDSEESLMVWGYQNTMLIFHRQDGDEIIITPKYSSRIPTPRFPVLKTRPRNDVRYLREFFSALFLLVSRRNLGVVQVTNRGDFRIKSDMAPDEVVFSVGISKSLQSPDSPMVFFNFRNDGRVETATGIGYRKYNTWNKACREIVDFLGSQLPV